MIVGRGVNHGNICTTKKEYRRYDMKLYAIPTEFWTQ